MSDSLRPHGCSLPGSSVHGIFQARILEWVAICCSRGYFWARDRTRVSSIADRRFTVWVTREAHDKKTKKHTLIHKIPTKINLLKVKNKPNVSYSAFFSETCSKTRSSGIILDWWWVYMIFPGCSWNVLWKYLCFLGASLMVQWLELQQECSRTEWVPFLGGEIWSQMLQGVAKKKRKYLVSISDKPIVTADMTAICLHKWEKG